MLVTLEQLKAITNQKESILIKFVDPINSTLEKYQINTKLRICHFLAQIIHECGRFQWMEELASGDAYDTRVDLGNTPEKDGDGRKFKGRGCIAITGKANYKTLSKAFGIDFVKTPELLKEPKWATLSAGWFWETRKLNSLADQDKFLEITKKINGGTNGLEDRKKYLLLAKSVIL